MDEFLEIAAGCFGSDGYGQDLLDINKFKDFYAVVLKSTSLEPIKGNNGQTFFTIGHRMYWNNVGLRNPGIKNIIIPNLPNLRLSLHATNDDDWCELINRANELNIVSIELNLSCPNIPQSGSIRDFDRVISKSEKPVFLKISNKIKLPHDIDGIDGIVCGNSIPYDYGGLSGIIAKYCNLGLAKKYIGIYPVIGCGGAENIFDIYEYINAGAIRVQLGSVFRKYMRRY